LHHGGLSPSSVFWEDGGYVLGEFTHKKEEMMVERDLIGLGTLAVYSGAYKDKRGYQATALSAKNTLKGLQWSAPFKSLLESLLDARPKSLREVSISLRDLPVPAAFPVPVTLPALNISDMQSKPSSASNPISSDRFFQQVSSRGDNLVRDAAVPSAITAAVGSVHMQTPKVTDRLPVTQGTEHSVRKELTERKTQTAGERSQFNFSKGYDIPIELQDEDDIDYSQASPQSIQPSQHSIDLGNRSKESIDQHSMFIPPADLSSVQPSNQFFDPRSDVSWQEEDSQSDAEFSRFTV
jgi:hypothetical protein